ncbi:MAG: hypothetical protein IJD79_06895 [Clostridia bacterium]|nr:hypothetical protein [Clostridia bacterium]
MKFLKAILCSTLLLSLMIFTLTSCGPVTPEALEEFLASKLGEDNPIVNFFDKLNGKNGDDDADDGTAEAPDGGGDNNTDDSTGDDGSSSDGDDKDAITCITVAEALELCGAEGNITTERYYIRATIKSVDNPKYGAMTIYDSTGEIYVYGTYSADGSVGYADFEYKPVKGDEVLLHCILQNYDGTKEVKNARLIEFKKGELDVNEADYTDMTAADAREAAKGAKIKLDGVVAAITYADGFIPSGFMLIDNTSSIYVYDVDVAGQVSVGNTVTLLGTKDYWILDKEIDNATKFGYQGCCQLTDARLLSNDKGNTPYDTSWIEETTVKSIMETPFSENITTKIFKVTALVKKVEGTGFTNYYIDDLDGFTGSYTYTQCSGDDFSWLDKYDGKICTVYFTVLNAKATAADCIYRFLPITVIDENYTFDTADAPEFAVEYYGTKDFLDSYTGDPATELITSVSSELLGFEGVTLTYFSDNTSVVYFTEEDGKTIFHCGAEGIANVTVTGKLGEKEYSKTISIKVVNAESADYISVKDAITASVGDTVKVKGIVGPSLVNKVGFYLFDGADMIAVLATEDVMATLEIGYEIVIEATRDRFYKDLNKQYGQTCLNNATVVANYYGNHEYSTEGFVADKTPEDFYNLDVMTDYSTTAFVLKGKIVFETTYHYTAVKFKSEDEKTAITLYCSGSGQYSWLEDYKDTVMTFEIAACNWNGKTFYAGCVLAVHTDDGKIYNDLNFN